MPSTTSCLIFWPYICISSEMTVATVSGVLASLFAFALGVGYERWKTAETKKAVLRAYRNARVELFEALDKVVLTDRIGSGSIPTPESNAACIALCAFRATVDWATSHQTFFDHREWRQICLARDYLAAEIPLAGDHRGRQLFNLETNPTNIVAITRKLRSFDDVLG